MWITKAEYQESGAEIVHRKCFWFDLIGFICLFYILYKFFNQF
jgi:hypothetical protein